MLTFSDGPRTCIGYRLGKEPVAYEYHRTKTGSSSAIFEIKVLLFTLLRHFQFHDTGAPLIKKVASNVQPVVMGQEQHGTNIPAKVTLL